MDGSSRSRLIHLLWPSHGALDVKRAYILPVLLQERHKEVDTQSDVADQVVIGHGDITDGNGKAQDL